MDRSQSTKLNPIKETRLRALEHFGFLLVVLLALAVGAGAAAGPEPEELDVADPVEPAEPVELPMPQFEVEPGFGIRRSPDLHTLIPTRQRFNILKYVVQEGDSLFGIADRFGLKPETVLWGNFEVLEDNPHSLKPGQELNIPPVDGTIYTWKQGDGLVGVASFFGVTAQDVIDWPGNALPQDLDLINPDIQPGTALVIPGGTRETVDWRAPRITRANPASARILGPGYCGQVYDGPVGAGFFVWPTPGRQISGYTFNPAVHPAIDIGGGEGNAIFAVDAGVVVYAGWHNGGYGNVVVIDHGNGWQSLYAHLSSVNVGCGDGLFQGNVLGGMGCTGNCTGNHLHFEMLSDVYGKVNPLSFLP